MPTTKAYANLGRQQITINMWYRVPLADPKADGNLGLEGHDEESEILIAKKPDFAVARSAAETWINEHQRDWQHIELRLSEYQDASFEHDGDWYQDAELVDLVIQYGYFEAMGVPGITWDTEDPV